jgi:hypothetical protein
MKKENAGFSDFGIIYNVTIKPEAAIAESWLEWLIEEHLPEVMQTKCFLDYKLVRLLDIDETEGPTFAVQYYAESKADYNRYIELHAAVLRKRSSAKWGQQFIDFSTVMEVVQ